MHYDSKKNIGLHLLFYVELDFYFTSLEGLFKEFKFKILYF